MSGFRRLVPLLAGVLALSACAGGPGPVVPDAGTTAQPACAPGAVEVGPTAEALQSAIDAARPGDALQLAPTTWSARGTRPGAPAERVGRPRPAGAAQVGRPSSGRPRSFADLRTGALEGRTFASLQEFAVAAVLEGGYSVSTIARLCRIQQWRLQKWVDEAAAAPRVRQG